MLHAESNPWILVVKQPLFIFGIYIKLFNITLSRCASVPYIPTLCTYNISNNMIQYSDTWCIEVVEVFNKIDCSLTTTLWAWQFIKKGKHFQEVVFMSLMCSKFKFRNYCVLYCSFCKFLFKCLSLNVC